MNDRKSLIDELHKVEAAIQALQERQLYLAHLEGTADYTQGEGAAVQGDVATGGDGT